jgi:hypothetical protein
VVQICHPVLVGGLWSKVDAGKSGRHYLKLYKMKKYYKKQIELGVWFKCRVLA